MQYQNNHTGTETMNELKELFENQKQTLNTIRFSKEVIERVGEIKLSAHTDEVNDLYRCLLSNTHEISPHFQFLKNGINQIDSLKKDGQSAFHFTPFIANKIQEIIADCHIPAPEWLPKTHAVAGSGLYPLHYYFNWSSVDPEQIPFEKQGFFRMRLCGELSDSTQRTPSGRTLSKCRTGGTGQVVHDESAQDVNHSIYVARKYLQLVKNAENRGIELNLTISELEHILKSDYCFFTGVALQN